VVRGRRGGGAGAIRVGFVGLGNMGGPMAARLVHAGFDLVGHDRDEAAAARLAERGGSTVRTIGEVARGADVVITMLPDGRVVRDVVTGPGGLTEELARGALVLDMSSSDAVGTRVLGAELEALGIALVDAPVSGGVAGAERGTLAVLAGGDSAAIERVRPILERLGGNLILTGALGSGHATKALNNLLSAAGLLAAAEVIAVGRRFGLDPEVLLQALNASSGRNNSTENKIAQFVLSRSFDSGFGLDLMVKDMRAALALAESTETPAPLGQRCLELWSEAGETLGEGADHTAVARWVEGRSDTEPGPARG
jgi:3-hydroxyisobutyrate dehydrogenase